MHKLNTLSDSRGDVNKTATELAFVDIYDTYIFSLDVCIYLYNNSNIFSDINHILNHQIRVNFGGSYQKCFIKNVSQ